MKISIPISKGSRHENMCVLPRNENLTALTFFLNLRAADKPYLVVIYEFQSSCAPYTTFWWLFGVTV